MTAAPTPNDTRGDRWLPRVINRVARLHPRLGMLRFEEALRRTTPALLRQFGTPGLQCSFAIGACAVRTVRFGLADVQSHRELSNETSFRLGSIAKPMTALGILTLVRDGLLHLDEPIFDDVRGCFAEGDAGQVARLQRVTSRHLLAHAAGIGFANPPRAEGLSRQEWLNWTAVRFDRDPGVASGYTGFGYALMEMVMEKRSGKRFGEAMQERVWIPLGVSTCRFEHDQTQSREHVAADHDEQGQVMCVAASVCDASSGLVATTRGVCEVMRRVHFEGRLLPRALASLQLTPQPPELNGATATLGLNLHGGVDAGSLSHGGTRPGHRSLLVVVPRAHGVFCVATNSERGVEVFRPLVGMFRKITMGA